MGTRRSLSDYGITTYRVRLALTNVDWARLKSDAQRKGLDGTQLIEVVLNDYASKLPDPEPEPIPDLEELADLADNEGAP